jgi:hypothetical protein
MALSDDALAAVFKGIFKTMRDSAGDEPKDDDWYAEKMAKAIDDQIKTADVNAGIAVSGGTQSGGSLVGAQTSAIGSLS